MDLRVREVGLGFTYRVRGRELGFVFRVKVRVRVGMRIGVS